MADFYTEIDTATPGQLDNTMAGLERRAATPAQRAAGPQQAENLGKHVFGAGNVVQQGMS